MPFSLRRRRLVKVQDEDCLRVTERPSIVGGSGCFFCKAFKVASVDGAGFSSEQKIRIAALKIRASRLDVTKAAMLDAFFFVGQ